jgi:hypothetical protein
MFAAFVSRIKRKSLIIFLFLTWYCFCIHFYVTICMKLDPGMHIGLHLIFFGKSGVTLARSRVRPVGSDWEHEEALCSARGALFTLRTPLFSLAWLSTSACAASFLPHKGGSSIGLRFIESRVWGGLNLGHGHMAEWCSEMWAGWEGA